MKLLAFALAILCTGALAVAADATFGTFGGASTDFLTSLAGGAENAAADDRADTTGAASGTGGYSY